MGKITYLLGAGASFGTRRRDKSNNTIAGAIQRGIPIVNEFETTIKLYKEGLLDNTIYDDIQYSVFEDELNWLAEKCHQYPTIDTYAKQLYITEGIHSENYTELKNRLSLFLTLIQNKQTRDLRYDGFIASLIQEGIKFPDEISILSWNYDSQFEFAFADYLKKDMNTLWKELNIYSKTFPLTYTANKFGIIKLNGSALLCDPKSKTLWDPNNTIGNRTRIMMDLYTSGAVNVCNTLSFAWEQDENLVKTIIDTVQDAEVLIIIGYSFPYVNRNIDRAIIQNMKRLHTIYIQDPNANSIEERFEAVLDPFQVNLLERKQIKIIKRAYADQFIIPNELS
ncbi:hypothetical protein [uncultured Alistipes sp.]|uniref:hypothetical protein n=1 Tax=uncultured Alistipes sp. TaxID=538949 RepID=UPI00262240AC|nr:hypothetical protein [uncultured Alistipes sp.]